MTPVKERPIIMTGKSVQAIRAGRKTMTRRICRLSDPTETYAAHDDDGWPMTEDQYGDWHRDRCPHGQPGERLYVKETFTYYPDDEHVIYKAREGVDLAESGTDLTGCWTSPLFMPRWASRELLEITRVRVERIQDISEEDAIAEGVDLSRDLFPSINAADKARELFRGLWDSINLKRGHGWEVNPWIWALTFKRITAPENP